MSDILIVGTDATALAARLSNIPAGVTVATAANLDEHDPELATVRALITLPSLITRAVLKHMPRLEWLQALSAGVDALQGIDLGPVAVSTASGVHGPQMAELAFTYMLGFARDLRGMFARQAAAQWQPEPQRLLAGSHVVIVGVGHIAEALAARCRAFDMRVTGVSGGRTHAPGFDSIVPMASLGAAAATADYLVVLSPYTPQTRHLISGAVIAELRPTAVLINLARGPVVDQEALIEALAAAQIAGAGLDVFDPEPLAPDSVLWQMRNVIITPHVGGWSTNLVEQTAPLVSDNIRRWFAKPRQPLLNKHGG